MPRVQSSDQPSMDKTNVIPSRATCLSRRKHEESRAWSTAFSSKTGAYVGKKAAIGRLGDWEITKESAKHVEKQVSELKLAHERAEIVKRAGMCGDLGGLAGNERDRWLKWV